MPQPRSVPSLLAKLAETRARGWGMVVEEAERGTAAMAMVVHDGSGSEAAVVGTASIAGPSVRHTAERMQALAPGLAAAAAELSQLWPMRRLTAPRAEPAPEDAQ
jgi:DNA-binding IclR family transcriptional regulator